MFFYILYKVGYVLANILPLPFAYWLAERLSDIQFISSKKDRDAVAQNLSIVLKKDVGECYGIAHKVFRNFGLYLVDFFRMGRLDEVFIKKRVRVTGLENLNSALGQGKGVVVLTCHIGNWEMGGVIVAIMGYNISAVALTHSHKNINKFFIRQRERKGLKVIAMGSVMKRCVSALLKKEILALVGDRDFTSSGIVLNFFGIPTSIPKGPASLSLRTGSHIVPCFFVREDRYNYKFMFEEPIEARPAPGISETKLIRETTERLIPIMERFIRSYPDQWLLFRRFWETPVDAFIL